MPPASNASTLKHLFDGSLGAAASGLWSWYRSEFFALFSPAAAAWLLDRGDRKLVIRAGSAGAEITLAGSRGGPEARIMPEEMEAATLDEVLTRRGMSRKATKVILELPRDKFLIRRFDVPAAARSSLSHVLTTEIERKTPFQLADVFSGHVLEQTGSHGEKLRVEQWILRRDIVERILDRTGVSMGDLDLVRPEHENDGRMSVPVIVVGRGADATNWFRYAIITLFVLGSILFFFGLTMTVWRQNQLDAELDDRIAAASARASRVRRMADQATGESALLATLRQEQERAPVLADLWEEISRVLPDSAYVTEMRYSEVKPEERIVDLTGVSAAAASLPALIDRSPFFSNATLTAAITPEAQEKSERFSLRAKVLRKGVVKPK